MKSTLLTAIVLAMTCFGALGAFGPRHPGKIMLWRQVLRQVSDLLPGLLSQILLHHDLLRRMSQVL